MTRKEQIRTIRTALRASIDEGIGYSQEIRTLAWVGGRPPELPVQRNEQGQRLTGKRALKPYRRPETGPQRNGLWEKKRWHGDYSTRYLLLALGFLRGRTYLSIERTADHPVSKDWLHRTLTKHLPDEVEISRDEITHWLAGDVIERAA